MNTGDESLISELDQLRASAQRYRTLFAEVDEGMCIIEMLFDAGGAPVDYRFLEMNRAFVKHTGLVDAVGKTVRELVPGHDGHWFDIYGRVATTGEPVRFVNEAHAWREQAETVVTVSDTGIGIAPESLQEVFTLFGQVGRDNDRIQGGLGIGLSLVRSLVELHGGSVKAASAGAGQGSVFTVRLPLAAVSADVNVGQV